jgi:hypothetical protein
MKNLIILFALLILAIPLMAQYDDYYDPVKEDFKPMVIVLNSSPDGMDLMIGNDDTTVFYTHDLANYDTTKLIPVNYTGTYQVYYKYPEDDDWVLWEETGTGETFDVTLNYGEILALRIGPDNKVYDTIVDFEPTFSAKIMFANLTEHGLTMMEVGDEFGDKNGAWCDDLYSSGISNFADVNSGSYSLFWQTQELLDEDDHYYYPDENDKPIKKPVEDNKWYQMMVFDEDGVSKCNFIDITPEDPMTDDYYDYYDY